MPLANRPMPHPSSGARLASTAGQILPLRGCALRVDAAAGLARLVFEQTFANPHDVPLAVTYKLPLPADAAVSAFAFRLGDRRIVGTVDKKRAARERFEQAILDGKSAALLEEERSSLFTQEIGNIPPRAELVAEITLDLPLAWTGDGAWELRFPLTAAPRYLGNQAAALGNVVVDVADAPTSPRASLSLAVRDALPAGRSPESPSHPLVCVPEGGGFRVELGSGNQVPLDRDVVVRWPVARLEPSAALDIARPPAAHPRAASAFALCTLVPPSPDAKLTPVARDLTLLVDTSGSMSGEPLEQAKRICLALVDGLHERDTLEMIEFSDSPRAFKKGALAATPALKKSAMAWLQRLQASGGTEMLSGVQAALKDLRTGAQRQVVLVTDGLVGFEQQIVGALLRGLPTSCRLHAVGVGSAVNRSLVAPIARAGRGVEIVVGLGEDPERAAARLFARTVAPAVVDVTVEGSAVVRKAPARLPDLFAGAPARVALELSPEGGEVVVRGRAAGGTWEQRIAVAPVAPAAGAEAVVKLFARESVEDLEMRIASGEGRLDADIEGFGLDFQISTRLTSWLAVTTEATVDPRDPTRKQTVPNALPFGMSAEGLGLRGADGGALHEEADEEVATSVRAVDRLVAAPTSRARVMAPSPAMPRGAFTGAPPPAQYAPPPAAKPYPGAAAAEGDVLDDLSLDRGEAAPERDGGRRAAPERDAIEQQRQGMKRKAAVEREAAPARELAKEEKADAPAKSPAKGGFLGRITERVREFFTDGSEPESPEPGEGGAADAPAEARSAELTARIVLRRGTLLVVELVAPDGGLDLDSTTLEAVVRTADGRDVTVTLDATRTTRAGRHEAGMVIRIALTIDAEVTQAESVVEVRISARDGGLVVTAR